MSSPRLHQTDQPEQIHMALDGIDFLLHQTGKSAGLARNDLLKIMKFLTLMRHAKSSWHHEGVKDFDRPLNNRGLRDAPIVAQHLSDQNLQPDLLWISPAERARQTAAIVLEKLAIPEEQICYKEEIYDAGLLQLLHLIRQAPESAEYVMMIGHNPGFSDLACILNPRQDRNVVTGAVVHLQLDIGSWKAINKACATTLWQAWPKMLSKD